MVLCYCDGGAKPNPGKCYGSYKIFSQDKVVLHQKKDFVDGTNNQAEYWALIFLLDNLIICGTGFENAVIRMDSRLVVKQVIGEHKVRNPKLFPLWDEVTMLLTKLKKVTFEHISGKEMKKVLGH